MAAAKHITLRVPPELLAQADEIAALLEARSGAAQHGISPSVSRGHVLRVAMARGLELLGEEVRGDAPRPSPSSRTRKRRG